MTTRRLLPALLLVVAAACGDDGNNTTPDAPPGGLDAPPIDGQNVTCAVTAGSIAAYPGTYAGTVLGGGMNHSVAMGICTVETGDQYYEPTGEDIVVKLEGLTVGSTYVVSMETEEDLSYYVTNDCPPTSGNITSCAVFTDETLGNETGTFVATATTHHVIVDNASEDPLATGAFTLNVIESECTEATEATDCTGATPRCVDNSCVQCAGAFDCTAGATPVCSVENTCVAGGTACTGDDAGDTAGDGDDGPAAANTLAAPGAATPTTVNAAACNSPDRNLESDWYKVTLPAGSYGLELTGFVAPNDLDVYLLDSTGAVVASGTSDPGIAERLRASDLAAGDYYVVVQMFAPAATVAAVPYTLKLQRAECADDFGCTVAGAPTCGPSGLCGAGPALCVGDDAADTGGGDDGPAGARVLTGAVGVATTLTGSICNSPGSEADFYKVVVTQGQGMTVALSWTGATDDLDPTVLDSTGATMGLSFWKNPENVALTYLPAGTYYISVTKFAAAASTAVTAYSISATRTAAQVCTTATNCASEFSTQIYRGTCDVAGGGVCKFIAPGTRAAGVACDSGDDCASELCSYISFDGDAQKSVCTAICTTTADCTAVGAGLTCTAGITNNNRCVPACTTDLECGANTGSSTLTAGQPWDYLTCTPADGVCTL